MLVNDRLMVLLVVVQLQRCIGSARPTPDLGNLMNDPRGLKSVTRFFGGCLWPANFLNRNDSQAQVAR
jgi:hypothetical protein